MKKLILICTIILSMIVPTFANVDDVTDTTIKTLNVHDAYEMALKQDKEILALEEKIEIQSKYILFTKEESERVSKIEKDYGDKLEDAVDSGTIIHVDPARAEYDLATYQRSLEDRKNTLKKELLVSMTDYLGAVETVDYAVKNSEALKSKYETDVLKEELGMLTVTQLYGSKWAYEDSKKTLRDAERAVSLKQLSFNHLLGLDEVTYTPMIASYKNIYDMDKMDITGIDLTALIVERIEDDNAIKNFNEDILELDKKIYTEKRYRYDADVIKGYEEDIVDKEKEIDKRKDEIEFQIKEAYFNLEISTLDIAIAKNTLENKKIDLKNIEATFQTGTISKQEFDNAEVALVKETNSYTNLVRRFLIDLYAFYEVK